MRSRLTSPTFVSIPTDNFITIDGYKTVTSNTVNALPDITDIKEKEAKNIIQIGKIDLSNSKNMLLESTSKLNALKVNSDNLIKGIIDSNKSLVSSFSGIAKSVKDGLVQARGYADIIATVNGISKKVKSADLTSMRGIGNMLDSISNSKFPVSFLDKSGLSNLTTNLVKEAASLGIPGSFTAIASSIKDKTILTGVAKNLLPDAIRDSTNGILEEIAQSSIGADVKKYIPGYLTDITGGYRKAYGSTIADSVREFGKIKEIAGMIDPSWNTCRKSSYDRSINVSGFSRGSSDFYSAMKNSANSRYTRINVETPYNIDTSTDTHEDKYMALISLYKDTNVVDELNRNFPFVHVTN